MEDPKPEEKSPLLLYAVEGDVNLSKNNKRVNFEKGRLYGISSGATAVFTEFPNYISPCWITALISSLIFFMMLLLMVSSMEPNNKLRVPRCTHSHTDGLHNKTVHLVHHLSDWNEEQLKILEKINDQFNEYEVRLILLRPEVNKRKKIPKLQPLPYIKNASRSTITLTTDATVSTTGTSRAVMEIKRTKRVNKRSIRNLNKKKRDASKKAEPISIGMGVKSLLDILLNSRLDSTAKRTAHNDTQVSLLNLTEILATVTTEKPQPKTLDDVILNSTKITVRNITFGEVFSKTPLEKNWFKLNKDLAIFAVRILQLWQYAGLSFKIDGIGAGTGWDDGDDFSVAPEITLRSFKPDQTNISSLGNDKLLRFISEGNLIYETLPKEVVTADDEGLHIFAKMPCHVFFGEILMNLKYARGDETPKYIIQKSLKIFCKHSAVDQNYCQKVIRRRG